MRQAAVFSGVLVLLVLFGWVTGSAFPKSVHPEDEVPPGFARLIRIAQQDGELRASTLVIVDWHSDRRIQRSLVRTPTGEHVVLTEVELPLSGERHIELLVEETGWKAELLEHTGLKLASVREAADPGAVASRFVRAEQPRRMVLRAPGLREPFKHASTTWDDDFLEDLYLVMVGQGESRRVVESMEPAVRRAVRFLDSAVSCGRCGLSSAVGGQGLIDLLARALHEESVAMAPRTRDETWVGRAEATAREVSGLGPAAGLLIQEFDSVSEVDPLGGLRPAQ